MTRPIDRRAFLARSATTAAGVALAGTAGSIGEGLWDPGAAWATTNGPGRNGISTAKPKRGGTLIFGVDAEEQGFNTASSRFDEVGVMYARTVFDPLAIITADGNWAPYLAKSIVPNAEYTSWTITLRPGVEFHDGTPLNGAALLMNFEAQLASLDQGIILKPVVEKVTQSGPLAVTIDLKQPWVPFAYYLAGGIGGQFAYVMAPSMINNPNHGGTDNPVGTGPFKFKEWVVNDHFTATANPNYWRKGYPYLDSITYKPIPDASSRGDALRAGTIDIMVDDTPQQILLFRGNRLWSYIDDSGPVVGEPDMGCVLLNHSAKPFDNPMVRLAAAKALSSPKYVQRLDQSVNAPSNGLFVPGTPYYSHVSYPTPDVKGAKELLAKAQHANGGQPITFSMGATSDASTQRDAAFIQAEWAAVGLNVSLTGVAQDNLINLALGGSFQALLWRQFSAVNPDLNYIFWTTTTITPSLSVNMARNADPLIEKALQTGRTSTNAEERAEAYQKVNARMAVDLPYLWNDRSTWEIVAHPSVQNFNNPTTPTGAKAKGMIGGSIWPTQIWRS